GMDFSGNGGSGGSDLACGTATAFGAVGAGTFLIVPPIIHGAHRRPEAAFGSLGLRSSVIGLGAFLESAGADSAFLVVNHLIGTRGIDWFLLAVEKREAARQLSSVVSLRPPFPLGQRASDVGRRGQSWERVQAEVGRPPGSGGCGLMGEDALLRLEEPV